MFFNKVFLPLLLAPVAVAFDYSLVGTGGLVLTDAATKISPLATLFTNEEAMVTVEGLQWEEDETAGLKNQSGYLLNYVTFVDGKVQASGSVSLEGVGRQLPPSIDAGNVKVSSGGRHTIEVYLTLDDSETSSSGQYQSYSAGVSIIPLVVVLLFAATTHMVEFSLFAGIFVGACMVAGNINAGFKSTLDVYILSAVADVSHGYVYLFTFFLSGLVSMMEKSGGMFGFTKDISKYATTARAAQVACFAVGVIIFFDDYANCLLAGKTLRPLMDSVFVSREKLAFIVDATAAPIASISPISSWVGFEIGLIQTEIDKIIEMQGTDDIGIKTSGFAVFLQSIKYRYYPIFMLILMMILVFSQRDFGTMLIAEKKSQVYKRTDGGDGATEVEMEGSQANEPRKDTPQKSWNMAVPIVLLVGLLFFLLVKTGEIEGEDQTFMEKIENSDSYSALLWATMATALLTLIFYLAQVVREGNVIIPDAAAVRDLFSLNKDADADADKARSLMSVKDSVESFLYGLGRVFPAIIVLTLAWASGMIMIAVGCDRLFSRWILGGVAPEALPTLSFVISMFMALATGTSWGTMSILFPLILVPTYEASNGDADIFYAVVAGILSGSVAGDHMSPISDTTVLSSLASGCNHLGHVGTQAPYAVVVIIISIIFGTLPFGYGAWPNIVGILLGTFMCFTFVYGLCAPVISPTGRFDPIMEFYLRWTKNDSLLQLKEDTVRAYNGEEMGVVIPDPSAKSAATTTDSDNTPIDSTAIKVENCEFKGDGSSSEEMA